VVTAKFDGELLSPSPLTTPMCGSQLVECLDDLRLKDLQLCAAAKWRTIRGEVLGFIRWNPRVRYWRHTVDHVQYREQALLLPMTGSSWSASSPVDVQLLLEAGCPPSAISPTGDVDLAVLASLGWTITDDFLEPPRDAFHRRRAEDVVAKADAERSTRRGYR
jgi:hypothetical protein